MTESAAIRRPNPPGAADERTMLEAFLDFERATLLMKVSGVSDDDARRPPVPSPLMTLAGLVKHLIDIERSYFRIGVAGEEVEDLWDPADPDGTWRVGADDRIDELLAAYQAECAAARAAVAGLPLDAVGRVAPMDGGKTLRYALVQVIQETARHNGHADIVREMIDGTVGE
jgi:uncharacterized damage-inducible protein DinB